MAPAPVSIDGFGPLPVLAPGSCAELGEAVRAARAAGEALYPVGGGTCLDLGLQPSKPGQAVELGRLDQVIDYPARDMTITVQAGITWERLANLLATEQQRLPIDVPRAGSATLGGVLSCNRSGPRRYGHGTCRDYVIGITVVNDEGQPTQAGGRVVKNVAGYDLCKLHVGALGTLGIITQVTLKVRPMPEENALLVLACPPPRLPALLDLIHGSRIQPVCVELLNPAAVAQLNRTNHLGLPEGWCVVVGLEGTQAAVSWQVQQLLREVKADYTLEARVGATAQPLWTGLVEYTSWGESSLTFKATVLPSHCADFCRRLSALPQQPSLQAHAGNGVVIGHLPADVSQQEAGAAVAAVREATRAARGWATVLRCPPAWKAAIPVWDEPEEALWLMRSIKEKFDPHGVFNPGRFLGSI